MDRRARPRGAAVALRRRAAHRRSAVADRGGAAFGRDPDGHRQGWQAAGGADPALAARCGSRLPGALPLPPSPRSTAVSRRARGGALSQGMVQKAMARARDRAWVCRPPPRPTRCATASRPISWARARICAACRNCSATPAWALPRSIRGSTQRRCSMSIARRIRAKISNCRSIENPPPSGEVARAARLRGWAGHNFQIQAHPPSALRADTSPGGGEFCSASLQRPTNPYPVRPA